jgi:hypothetical protein
LYPGVFLWLIKVSLVIGLTSSFLTFLGYHFLEEKLKAVMK